jgi:hypothetical protein
LGEKELRAYFAAVIGTFRAPFGVRKTQRFTSAGESFQLVQNSTRNKVLSVFVSRRDGGVAVPVTFSSQTQAGTSDFAASFAAVSVFRFVLYPDDSISMTLDGIGVSPVELVVGHEPY